MTAAAIAVKPLAPVSEVARVLRDENIGMALIADTEQLDGLATDRDLVVRGLAAGEDMRLAEVDSVHFGRDQLGATEHVTGATRNRHQSALRAER